MTSLTINLKWYFFNTATTANCPTSVSPAQTPGAPAHQLFFLFFLFIFLTQCTSFASANHVSRGNWTTHWHTITVLLCLHSWLLSRSWPDKINLHVEANGTSKAWKEKATAEAVFLDSLKHSVLSISCHAATFCEVMHLENKYPDERLYRCYWSVPCSNVHKRTKWLRTEINTALLLCLCFLLPQLYNEDARPTRRAARDSTWATAPTRTTASRTCPASSPCCCGPSPTPRPATAPSACRETTWWASRTSASWPPGCSSVLWSGPRTSPSSPTCSSWTRLAYVYCVYFVCVLLWLLQSGLIQGFILTLITIVWLFLNV